MEQESGTTVNNFNGTVTYRVQACDRSTVEYAVTVTRGSNVAKIDTFSINGSTGIIVGNNISLELPCGTDRSSLVADFTKTGYKVFVGEVEQQSGVTENNFTGNVIYKVVSCDETFEQNYTVSTTITGGDSKDIIGFSFNDFTDAIYAGTIDGTDINFTLPSGTNLTRVATFSTTTVNEVTVNGTAQYSGVTSNDFSGDLTYIVNACDLSTKNYTVHTTLASPPNMLSFLIDGHPCIFSTNVAGIHYIDLTLPTGTDVTNMITDFTFDGDHVEVGGVTQASGSTRDFTNPVTYTVYAADLITFKDYIVTVTLQ